MTVAPDQNEISKLVIKIRADSEKYANLNGWVLNPDPEVTDTVLIGLARNKLTRGRRYCPCRLPSGDPKVDHQFICPCQNAKVDVTADGHCHCYLYISR